MTAVKSNFVKVIMGFQKYVVFFCAENKLSLTFLSGDFLMNLSNDLWITQIAVGHLETKWGTGNHFKPV